jgi:hypothetical protein
MNRIYRFTGATLLAIGIGIFWGRKMELRQIFQDNEWLNRVYRQVYPGADDQVFISNQPWI